MAGRPPLPPGTYGKIKSRYLTPQTAIARARFRDWDGEVRTVARTGPTQTAAENALKEALRDRQYAASDGDITPQTTVAVAARAWLEAGGAPKPWADGTLDTYTYIVNNQVIPALGGIRLGELRLSAINRALNAIKDKHGPGSASTTKKALSGICKYAISFEAMDRNLMRDSVSIAQASKTVRALTVEETTDLCDRTRSDEQAVLWDLPDLVDWMLGTGARLGECCAARAGTLTLDLEVGLWEINSTIIRKTGHGLIIQPRPKSKAGWRVIAIPEYCRVMALERLDNPRFKHPDQVVFGAPIARAYRDRANTAADLRVILDRLGYEWVSSHVFRKTVATRLDEAGWSARQIADHLGHAKPSVTQDVYMGRKVVSLDAARVLDR